MHMMSCLQETNDAIVNTLTQKEMTFDVSCIITQIFVPAEPNPMQFHKDVYKM